MIDRLAVTWLVLVVATAAALGFRLENLGVAAVGLAYVKGRLVVLEYMELRDAPWIWRGVVEGWLFTVTAAILGVYWLC